MNKNKEAHVELIEERIKELVEFIEGLPITSGRRKFAEKTLRDNRRLLFLLAPKSKLCKSISVRLH